MGDLLFCDYSLEHFSFIIVLPGQTINRLKSGVKIKKKKLALD